MRGKCVYYRQSGCFWCEDRRAQLCWQRGHLVLGLPHRHRLGVHLERLSISQDCLCGVGAVCLGLRFWSLTRLARARAEFLASRVSFFLDTVCVLRPFFGSGAVRGPASCAGPSSRVRQISSNFCTAFATRSLDACSGLYAGGTANGEPSKPCHAQLSLTTNGSMLPWVLARATGLAHRTPEQQLPRGIRPELTRNWLYSMVATHHVVHESQCRGTHRGQHREKETHWKQTEEMPWKTPRLPLWN